MTARATLTTARCLTVNEMQAKGFSRNPPGFWITAAMPNRRSGDSKTAAIGTDPLPTQGGAP